jgi:spore germination protein YaaH
LARHAVEAKWDDRDKSAYAFWSNNGVNEFLWLEDARAFMSKLELVTKYKLRGYSVWVLGTEDPKIWSSLPAGR